MPVFQKGDMWSVYSEADLFLITTNSTLQPGNILVMGRGIAKQAHERFPGLNKALGQQIAQTCGRNGQYGLLISPRWPQAKIGAFQTKTDARQPASLKVCALFNKSRRRLISVPLQYKGFDLPDKFVVGYGLDYRELYRNLPFVGLLKPTVFAPNGS